MSSGPTGSGPGVGAGWESTRLGLLALLRFGGWGGFWGANHLLRWARSPRDQWSEEMAQSP